MKAIYKKDLIDSKGNSLTLYKLVDIVKFGNISSMETTVNLLEETYNPKIAKAWGVSTKCEYTKCKAKATQADTYLNVWLCDNHYSYIGVLTDDYQKPEINWDLLETITT